jgi:hypothetical protein
VIIKLWKIRGAENLVKISKEFKFQPENGPIYLDLLDGKVVVDGGDLKIKLNRTDGVISPQRKADWSLSIAATDGDVQQVTPLQSRVTFEAPTGGYEKEITFERKALDPSWSMQVDTSLFLRSRNANVYSKISISFLLNEAPNSNCWLGITALSNPNGSRN